MATPNLIFQRAANGIRNVKDGRFYPFRSKVLTNGQTIPTKPNTRIFLDSVNICYASLVTDAGTTITVTGTQDGETITLAQCIKTTLLVNLFSQDYRVGILLDKETPVTVTAADITSVGVRVQYTVIDDV